MAVEQRLRLRGDATTEMAPDGTVTLAARSLRAPVGRLGRGLRAGLAALSDGGATEAEIAARVTAAEGEEAVLKLQLLLRRLDDGGWTERVVVDAGAPVATLRPLGNGRTPRPRPLVDDDETLVLSRFAHLRRDGDELVWETPRSTLRVVVHDAARAGLAARLAQPVAAAQAAGDAADRALLGLLVDASVAVRPGEEDAAPLGRWSFADLLFHARSRVGRHVGEFGGSYFLEGTFDPLPALKPAYEPVIALPRADLVALARDDVPLTRVLEERVSTREHDDEHPMTVAQLGELLYRVARQRASFHDGHQELSSRPYPAGGALYELELYPLVHNVDGLDAGLYHYDPGEHALGLVAEPGPRVDLVREYGRITATMDTPPQVLVVVAARFGRPMWKYESMAYALVLKHVGVLYQTAYLVATAMGLAVCTLGGGPADAFAAAAGTDYYEETSVGELVLGARRRPDAGSTG